MRRFAFLAIFAVGVTAIANSSVSAQGTASAPSTAHTIDSSTNTVWMGGPNDSINGPAPQPIDLDPNGAPWRKSISAGSAGYGGGPILIRETIQNVGTEPWTDWHETFINGNLFAGVWLGVTDMRINGTSITYSASITGNTLDLDNFSQSVQPGDTLEIDKEIESLLDVFLNPGTPLVDILEYPTTVIPEPSSVLLFGIALVGAAAARRTHR